MTYLSYMHTLIGIIKIVSPSTLHLGRLGNIIPESFILLLISQQQLSKFHKIEDVLFFLVNEYAHFCYIS